MFIVRNRFLPFPRFDAINLFGILFVHRNVELTPEVINHERIHTAQMVEMAVVGFYLWYLTEWLIRLFLKGNAYRKLRFEQEAYEHQHELDYLKHRKPFAWIRK